MVTNTKNKLLVKLFFGTPLTSELKMYLSNSIEWKKDLMDKQNSPLTEVQYQENLYFGYYVDQNKLSFNDLEKHTCKTREKLSLYCPEFDNEKLDFLIFPQVFIK